MEERTKRRHVRFAPERSADAAIDLDPTREEFKSDVAALIVDEAPMGGVCLLVLRAPEMKEGKKLRVRVGDLAPLNGIVVWRTELDTEIAKVGIRFLE